MPVLCHSALPPPRNSSLAASPVHSARLRVPCTLPHKLAAWFRPRMPFPCLPGLTACLQSKSKENKGMIAKQRSNCQQRGGNTCIRLSRVREHNLRCRCTAGAAGAAAAVCRCLQHLQAPRQRQQRAV